MIFLNLLVDFIPFWGRPGGLGLLRTLETTYSFFLFFYTSPSSFLDLLVSTLGGLGAHFGASGDHLGAKMAPKFDEVSSKFGVQVRVAIWGAIL